ncbi:MAG: hypothetical protein FWF46_06225 [Oscillospiraceae bacterium]|nr:hypothetical protein [Oscillospiraceae bacterium]
MEENLNNLPKGSKKNNRPKRKYPYRKRKSKGGKPKRKRYKYREFNTIA